MYRANAYQVPANIQEALELLRNSRRAVVLGGNTWLRLGNRRGLTLVELSRLGLDRVEEQGDWLCLGAMVPMRELETHPLLRGAFGGVLGQSVRQIVGVQFRNQATLGPSVYHKYGFSDLLTALSVLDCEVELAGAGRMPLEQWLAAPRGERDILVALYLRRDGRRAAFESLRNAETDFAVLHAAASQTPAGHWAIAVGARPGRARRCPRAEEVMAREGAAAAGRMAAEELEFGNTLRGSGTYRRALAEILVRRALEALEEEAWHGAGIDGQ